MTDEATATIATEKIRVFEGLSKEEVQELLAGAIRKTALDKERIISEGDPVSGFYILETGAVRVLKAAGDEEYQVARLEAPTAFGEMGLITRRERAATVIADGESQVWHVPAPHFDNLCKAGSPCIAKLVLNIARTIAVRLEQLDTAFAELAHKQAQNHDDRNDELERFRKKLYTEWVF